MQVQDWVIDIYCDFDNFVLNPKCHSSLIVPESHLLATIKFTDNFFEITNSIVKFVFIYMCNIVF